MERILDRARRYAAGFDGKHMRNLLFIGTTGLGKTHLSSAIAKEVVEGGFDVVYESAQRIFSDFEAEKFGRAAAGKIGRNAIFPAIFSSLTISARKCRASLRFPASIIWSIRG